MSPGADMGLSQAQAAAVADTRPQVLVAAAAGSGKTRLLVASVVRALVDEQLPIERLVAVTFTRKAGAELAARVREALEACGRTDLALSLDSAMVGTIDSLCRRLVKERALEAEVDPGCGVLEAEAAELVKADVINRSWEAVAQQADEERLRALARHGAGLRRDVVALYDRLRALGQEEPRVDIPAGPPETEARRRLERAVGEALAEGVARDRPSASLQSDLEKLRELTAWLEEPAQTRVGEAALLASAEYFPSRRTRTMEEHFAPVRAALTDYRCALAEPLLAPLTDLVNALLSEFHRGYTSAKAERGLADFADLELKARALLMRSGADGQSDEALGACAPAPMEGAFLLVDEFQDTNELQCAILSQLGADRILMVGDERQSIYRFRGADVDVFRRRREALDCAEVPASQGSLHRLDVNYRSSTQILNFINALFSRQDFFGGEFAPLSADPSRTPVGPAGGGSERVGPTELPTAVQVLVAERRPASDEDSRLVSGRQAEAEALARAAHDLVRVEGWRQRDIVVLLPTQIEVEAYQEALLSEGLDVYVVRGKGYYAQEEVTDVTSLLRVLVSPHDDLALLSVLRSPLVALSDDALYLLGKRRRTERARSLWQVVSDGGLDCLDSGDRAALSLFLERTGQLRARVGRPGLARFIDEAISAFSYDLCLLAARGGRMRFANVRKLMRLADEFESAEGPDLPRFLSVIRSMGQIADREGSAPTLGENEDVVRIMTVHQAKGLEFPVVMLAGLGADAHRPDAASFAVGADGRVGVFLKGFRKDTYETYDPHWGPAADIAADEVRREREEDVRLLYVAMTRAQERLLLVGARPLKDSMDGSRIGRIVSALGLSEFPAGGETASLRCLSATVTGIGPEDPAETRPGSARATSSGSRGAMRGAGAAPR